MTTREPRDGRGSDVGVDERDLVPRAERDRAVEPTYRLSSSPRVV